MKGKLNELSDEELMVLYKQGQDTAFACLYARYEARVYGYLRKRLQDPQAANDVFQAAFLKFHRSKDQFNSSFMFAPWLFAVVRTSLVDWQKSRQNTQASVELNEELHAPISIETPAIAREDLSQLPEPQRMAVELRYFDDFSFEEIALRLETSPGNVRQLVSRGLRQLRSLFAKGGSR
jgi:RNA polymerase sigma-70 factor (ECF subfamily)